MPPDPFTNLTTYWGILHCHIDGHICHYLDRFDQHRLDECRQQIDTLVRYARDHQGYDFLSYADHHNMGHMIELGTADDSPWNEVLRAWRSYNDEGRFVTILGYEYQDRTAEFNVYLNRDDLRPNGDRIDDIIAALPPDEPSVILAAHYRPRPTDWSFPVHPNFRLVEIINDGGTPFESWARAGLRAGHRVGFIGGSDDHACHPGYASSTGVWAKSLSRSAVWEALTARRTIATTGIRPRLWFDLNGRPMGSEVELSGERRLRVCHDFDRCPAWLGIIKNGELLAEYVPEKNRFTFTVSDPAAAADTDIYYVKLIYRDGHYAFTSPVWVSGQPAVTATKPHAPPPSITDYRLAREWGESVGRSNWFNASGLLGDFAFSRSLRDMVCHLGPDPVTTLPDNRIVYPTMDAVVTSPPDDGPIDTVHRFREDEAKMVLTSLAHLDGSILAAGYLGGKPFVRTLRGRERPLSGEAPPIHQYLWNDELISPSFLAADGTFSTVLYNREGVLFAPDGTAIGYFQDGYPACPVSVRIRSLSEIYVLSFDGRLLCYSFAASTVGRRLWTVELGDNALSLTIVREGVLIYNGTTTSHAANTTVRLVRRDGSDGGTTTLDLYNRRGTSLTELSDGSLLGLHNPSDRISAIYRASLNETGTLRRFARVPPGL